MNGSDVSVVIPSYNRYRETLDCIESILQSSIQPREIVVVDDCSTDNSIKYLKKSNVKTVFHQVNRGPAAARNTGAKNSAGQILVFVDSDVLIQKDTLQKFIDSFQRDSRISAVVGIPGYSGKFSGIAEIHFLMRVYFNYINLPDFIKHTTGTITAVRRDVFEQIGGYNENLKTPGIEDDEFGLNVYRNNGKIYLDKSIVVIHNKKIGFLDLLKNDIARTVDRIFYMFRKKQLKSTLKEKRFISTPMSQILSALFVPFIFLLMVLTVYSETFVVPLFLSLTYFYYLNAIYIKFVRVKLGVMSSIKIYFLLLVDMFFVHFGLWKGLVLYGMGRRY